MRKAFYWLTALLLVAVMVTLSSGARPLRAQSGPATTAPTGDLPECSVDDTPTQKIRSITVITFSPDGKYLVSNRILGMARMWDVETGKVVRDFPVSPDDTVTAIVFSPDGKYLLTALIAHFAIVWDITTGKEISRFDILDEQFGPTSNAVFSLDGKYVLIGYDGGGRLWDVQTGALVRRFKIPDYRGIRGGHAEFSPDGKRVLVDGGNVLVFDSQTGNVLFHSDNNRGTFSPDGKYIVTSNLADPSATILTFWDAEHYTQIRTIAGGGEMNDLASFSPDGKYLLTYDEGSSPDVLALWNVDTGQRLHDFDSYYTRFFHKSNYVLATEPTGKSDDMITFRVWDYTAGKEMWNFPGDEGIESIFTISPDDKYVAIVYRDFVSIHLRDIRTGQIIRKFC